MVTGASALLPGEHDKDDGEAVAVTNPVRRVTGEVAAQDVDGEDVDVDSDLDGDLATTMQTPRPVLEAPRSEPARSEPARSEPAPRTSSTPAPVTKPATPVGAGYLARYPAHHGTSKLPWLLVMMLGMAVLGLVAYIVMQ